MFYGDCVGANRATSTFPPIEYLLKQAFLAVRKLCRVGFSQALLDVPADSVIKQRRWLDGTVLFDFRQVLSNRRFQQIGGSRK
jgi:hypothetical protein